MQEERVLAIQRQLACQCCICHLVPLLIRLARVPLTTQILRRTRIGRTVQVLRLRHKGTMAGRAATCVIKQWQKLYHPDPYYEK